MTQTEAPHLVCLAGTYCADMMRIMKASLLLLLLLLTLPVRGQGISEAMSGYVGTTSDVFSPVQSTIPGTIGWTFDPLENISITALGAFNYSLPSGSTRVGLWSSDGQLLASTIITSSSMLVNQSRYGSITPLILTAGQTYYLGEFSASGTIQSVAVNPTEAGGPDGYALMSSAIQLEAAAWETDPGFEFPSITDGAPGSAIIAPNFEFQIVPEPSLPVLTCAGLGLLFAYRRLRSK